MQASYETLMVLSTTLDEEAGKALVAKFTELISTRGTVESVDEWGKRRLAYPINDETEGNYVLVNFTADTDLIAELNRIYAITDGLLRTIVVRKEQ
ncbi:MAG: 30S ribosomal protein S6 [Oscillospiraceae bacterium]|nr:30S ribosomal protein S6 [Oscillospiraceae bacterium]MBQ9959546.1 30S ribosomal protein S6 [Oscillospiraceae bacterium]